MTDRNLILEAINEIDNSVFDRPFLNAKFSVSEDDIKEVERSISISFPLSYRMFLNFFGSGEFRGMEIRGLVPNKLFQDTSSSALTLNRNLQRDFDFPDDLFAFENHDGDAVSCLMLSWIEDGECPVILWDHSESYERQLARPHILAESFGAYFLHKVRELIAELD
ncbi:SMI1/KNR4 family protein [Alterisphingorhabdus coralli]|uniref:SMI1/KNR4 family protein n=1 Tax=Alterisphingorhabdus coralli TaxID=3071408 RepID=A0AA97I109_9SPHN|nr:SMI1/KNR4 family protein [Parasphingorhabdus sp. SCSIO 66989]WOE74883.1 SMI1/KNR4 family protein [Parasphingorhabdus sp. SCSIO 66989]